MSKISKEAFKKCETKTTDKAQYLWLSRTDFQIESGYSNWAAIFTNVIEINKNPDMN